MMVTYEFYLRDEVEGDKLIGVLPERRNDLERTDLDSLTKWVQAAFGDTLDLDNVYIVAVRSSEGEEGKRSQHKEILVPSIPKKAPPTE
jgi:hypothetical protein